MRSNKVYDLGYTIPKPGQRKVKVAPPNPARPKPRPAGKPVARILATYLAGPLAAAVFANGSRRTVWAVITLLTIAVAAVVALAGPSATTWLLSRANGLLIWLIVVPGLWLGIAAAWTFAIAETSDGPSVDPTIYPRALRRRAYVLALGLIAPGLGLRFLEFRKQAVVAFAVVGPLVASLLILAPAGWLWRQAHTLASPGISGITLEKVIVIAAVVATAGALLWLVQALDGARRAPGRRSFTVTNMTSVALLLVLALGVLTFRPSVMAQNLHDAATALKLEGFQLIPLGLCEVATRLDPAEPRYLADAAELNEVLGMTEAASLKHEKIERRMNEYLGIVRRANNDTQRVPMMSSQDGGFDKALDVEDHVTPHTRPTL